MVDPHDDLPDEDDALGKMVWWGGAAAFGFRQPLHVLQYDMLLEPHGCGHEGHWQ